MTILSDKTYPRTLDGLITRLLAEAPPEGLVEAWLFEDEGARRRGEARLAEAGISARLHSAYKPLLHFVLEDLAHEIAEAEAITLRYPLHRQAPENRFLLETYPLAALYPKVRWTFEKGEEQALTYRLLLERANQPPRHVEIFAPNRLHRDAVGEQYLSPTGWLRIRDGKGRTITDQRLPCDLEILFAETIAIIANAPWRSSEPFFDQLNISVSLPGDERPLPWGREVISLREALHEDLYFSLLEFFQQRGGRPLGDRGLKPGQIVPEVRQGEGPPRVVIASLPLDGDDPPGPHQDLATAATPLAPAQIAAELATIAGTPFTAISLAGRTIAAIYHPGQDLPVMISGGQHANETSGVVGALRAAHLLAARATSHFTVAPLENPDGYALHRRLIRDNPDHMHHAARYTALGDDLGHRGNDLHEAAILRQALRLSGARLHINLHGYPSHEWTRPFSGYVPRGFAIWTLPKGFFLIIRHHAAWESEARHFLEKLCRRLATHPGLVDFNQRQMELYRRHSATPGFPMLHGFPYLMERNDDQETPLMLITEYPDETCHGPSFVAAHEAQTAAALAAYEVFQEIEGKRETAPERQGEGKC